MGICSTQFFFNWQFFMFRLFSAKKIFNFLCQYLEMLHKVNHKLRYVMIHNISLLVTTLKKKISKKVIRFFLIKKRLFNKLRNLQLQLEYNFFIFYIYSWTIIKITTQNSVKNRFFESNELLSL